MGARRVCRKLVMAVENGLVWMRCGSDEKLGLFFQVDVEGHKGSRGYLLGR